MLGPLARRRTGIRPWKGSADATEALGGRTTTTADRLAARLVEGLPVTTGRLDLAGVSTSLLEGGEGLPMVVYTGRAASQRSWAGSSKTWPIGIGFSCGIMVSTVRSHVVQKVVAERWTPIILSNLLAGCHTFNEIAAGAPGLSRELLTRRLREI